jgi:hypothetical protein
MRQPRNNEPTYNAREAARFQPADDVIMTPMAGETEVPEEFYGEPYDPQAWLPIDDATPRDGTVIEYKLDANQPDEKAATARWKVTRMREHYLKALEPGAVVLDNRSQWITVGYWSHPLTREQLSPAPGVWRMPAGFINPAKVLV